MSEAKTAARLTAVEALYRVAKRKVLQVLNLNVAPFLLEVLSNKPSMAMVGCGFAAKQACAVQQISIDIGLDMP